MKALSIRQPWAWLIVNGRKPVENRTWPTRWRGRLLIHAAKTMTWDDYAACVIFVRGFSDLRLPRFHDLERGGIVGMATLDGCVTRMDSPWFCGPYGFVLILPGRCEFQPMPGRQGIFEV
jgi:hypothetical protein